MCTHTRTSVCFCVTWLVLPLSPWVKPARPQVSSWITFGILLRFLPAACPSWSPSRSVKALKALNVCELTKSDIMLFAVLRRGRSGCWWFAAWVVHHHITRDLQCNVCAVLYITGWSCDLHYQPSFTLQLQPSQLLQVCRPYHCQGCLWQQAAWVLLYTIVLQTHSRRPTQVSLLCFDIYTLPQLSIQLTIFYKRSFGMNVLDIHKIYGTIPEK